MTFNNSALLAFIPALFNLAIFFYILFYLPKGKTTDIFSLFVLALLSWQVYDTILRICESADTARFWDKILCIGWLSVAPLAFHFACRYSGEKKFLTRRSLILIYVPFVLFYVLYLANNNNLVFVYDDFWGWINIPRHNSFDAVQRYFISIVALAALFILFRRAYILRQNKARKLQALLIAVGILVPSVQGILTQVVFPLILHVGEIPVTSSFLTVFSLATIIALGKYKLLDISESIPVNNMMETLTNMVFIVSPEREIIYVNPHAAKVFGFSTTGDIQGSLEKLFLMDKLEYSKFTHEVLDSSLAGNVVKNYDTVWIATGNKKMDVLVSTDVVINNGVVQGVMVVANDITERKRMEQILEIEKQVYEIISKGTSSEEAISGFLRNIEEASPNNILCMLWYPDDNFEKIVPGPAPSVPHSTAEHFAGNIIGPKGLPAGRAMYFRKTITINNVEKEELPMQTKSLISAFGFKSLRSYPIISSSGKVLAALTYYTNSPLSEDSRNEVIERAVNIIQIIMEREEVTKKLGQQQQVYMDLVNSIEGVVYSSDPITLKYTFVSERAEQLLGYPKSQWLAEEYFWLKHIHPDDRQGVLEFVVNEIQKGRGYSCEYRMIANDGRIVWFKDIVTVEKDTNRVAKLRGIMVDVTTEKNLALERESMTEDLIQRNKDLEQFTYIVSHNLRAPVANIIGVTGLINNFDLSEAESDQVFKELENNIKKLDNVIFDLNRILQVKHGVNDKKEMISFTGLLDEVKSLITDQIEKENVTIRADFTKGNEFLCVKSYMHSVFYNLISNSIKYSKPQTAAIIHIRSTRQNGKLMLSFKDNGLGIDLKTSKDHVFGLYKRFHNHVDGKGMGLFMVKTQVEKLGGKIEVESAVDEGTEFTMEFEA